LEEVIVIDDGSTDQSAEIARKYPVRLIQHGKNKGLAASRNTAFEAAQGEYVAALDADCVADKEWLAGLMKLFEDETVAGVGGMLVEKYASTLADHWRAVHMAQYWGPHPVTNPPFLYGSNTVFRKEDVQSIGGYSSLFKTNFEDVDISGRFVSGGYRLIYNPESRAAHLRTDSLNSVIRTYWKWRYGHKSYLKKIMDFPFDIFRFDLRNGYFNLLPLDCLFAAFALGKNILYS
jgi:GT2 family glycosyltransferase